MHVIGVVELSGASSVNARTLINANDNVAYDNVVSVDFGKKPKPGGRVVANEDFALAA